MRNRGEGGSKKLVQWWRASNAPIVIIAHDRNHQHLPSSRLVTNQFVATSGAPSVILLCKECGCLGEHDSRRNLKLATLMLNLRDLECVRPK